MGSYQLALWAALALGSLSAAQQAPSKLNLVIVEGEGAINNIRQRIAREPIVQVEDENRNPVAGAAVTFVLPNVGPGATFADGSTLATFTTGPDGRAVARGLRPNNQVGQYQIRVNASFQGQTATATITQSNVIGAAAAGAGAGAAAGGISGKMIAIIAVIGAAAAGGIAAATLGGGNGNAVTPGPPPPTPPPGPTPTTISAGAPRVGAP